jgi:uncharacterized protein (TIGR03437 family)
MLGLLGGLAYGQPPVISAVLNAASQIPGAGIAPQMWVAITGQNLASTIASSSANPLPQQIEGTSVTFNGYPAPLSYVSPTQVNAQVPSVFSSMFVADVIVTTAAGSSAKFTVPVLGTAPGIFTQDYSGCKQGLIYNIHDDGSIALNTPESSLDPLKDLGLAIFMTGVGYFSDRTDGVPWTYNPSDNSAFPILSAQQKFVLLGMPGAFDDNVSISLESGSPASYLV